MKILSLISLLGIAVTLSACDAETQAVEPGRKSQRQEGCSATNDCDDGLLCIGQVCTQSEYPIAATARDCRIVNCSSNEDCCEDFVESTACPTYEADCAAGVTTACQTYDALCVCNRECQDGTCQAVPTPCTDDIECAGVCVSGSCVDCREESDCLSDTQACAGNECVERCTADNECPAFHSCTGGTCVHSGCKSDRECILYDGDATSVCRDGVCEKDCTSNAQCNVNNLEVCSDGVCTFIGCEADSDCTAYLDGDARLLEEGARAVCAEATE